MEQVPLAKDYSDSTFQLSDDLSLTPFLMSDVDDLVEVMKDESISRSTLSIPYPYTIKEAESFVGFLINVKSQSGIHFAIRNKEGRFIGSIALLNLQLPLNSTINKHFKGSVGYYLDKSYRGRGIMPKCIHQLLKIAFDELGLERVEAPVFAWNDASSRALEKAGFVKEGLLRSYYFKYDEPVDGLMWSMIKADWIKVTTRE